MPVGHVESWNIFFSVMFYIDLEAHDNIYIYIMLKILKYVHRYVFLAGTLSYNVIEDSGHWVTVRQQGFDGNIVITCGA